MPRYRKLLIVKADGTVRIGSNTGRTRVKPDECAYPLVINMPNEWGKISTEEITVTMPKPPTVTKEKK